MTRLRPHQIKLLRDLWLTRGRVALMIVAVAIALTGLGAMLVARSIIASESAEAYQSTIPASAALDVDGGVDQALLAEIRKRPGILDATARQTITTRARVDGQWRRLLLFVIDPRDQMTFAKFTTEIGHWPGDDAGIMVERAAMPVLDTAIGQHLQIAGPDGTLRTIEVTGRVYDPALAPAPQENTGYGYLTPAAATRLGYTPLAEDLRILIGDRDTGLVDRDQRRVDATATELAAWLGTTGHPVHQVSAPPYRHPHAVQAATVTSMFLGFAIAALLLAGALVAATMGAMLAAQTRQIGVLKTIGATTPRVLRMYLGVTALIGAVATTLAVLPAVAAGYGLASAVCDMLNVDITGVDIPPWVFLAMVAAGIGVPVAVAMVPLRRAARITVRQALDDQTTGTGPSRPRRRWTGQRWTERNWTGPGWTARLTALGGRSTAMALRNLARRRSRLVLTMTLLAAGGALFTSGLNTADAWQRLVDDGLARRSYTAEIQLLEPAAPERIAAALRGVDGVTATEPIRSVPAVPAGADLRQQVLRVYPDGGHGRFNLVTVPPATTMVGFEVLSGRWLRDGDRSEAVLNQAAAARLGTPAVGDDIQVSTAGQVSTWHVVGIVAEVGGYASVYTATGTGPATAAGTAGDTASGTDTGTGATNGPATASGTATGVRMRTSGDVAQAAAHAEAALTAAGMPPASTLLTRDLREAIDGHVVIFIYTMIALAVLMAAVGFLGLASTMTIAVAERTREYGIMQTLGATPRVISRMILTEGVMAGLLGCAVAFAASVPLSKVVGDVLGRLSFDLRLPLTVSPGGTAIWVFLALFGALAATGAAARRGSRTTIRETLTQL